MDKAKSSISVPIHHLIGATATLTLALIAPVLDVQATEPLTVVELYTSQGCSSCPPADVLLGELAGKPNVLALSFHVDYWDYIGWKDPFALKKATQRQRAYAEQLQLRYVYTPQIIVGGKLEVVGSQRKEVRECLQEVSTKIDQTDQIALKKLNDDTVSLPATKLDRPLEIWQVDYTPLSQTQVLRGENRGKKLNHHNSVRAFERIAIWNGDALTLKLKARNYEASALLLQEQKSGPIRAALIVK